MTKKKSIFTQEVIVGIVLIALYFLFRTISSDFGKYTTFLSMMDISYYYAFMAIGVAFPLITGGVDLSIGTGMICYALAGGFLIRQYNCPTILAILVSILFGVGIGLLNGVLISSSFLANYCLIYRKTDAWVYWILYSVAGIGLFIILGNVFSIVLFLFFLVINGSAGVAWVKMTQRENYGWLIGK